MGQTHLSQDSSLPSSNFYKDDEIDLKELFAALWKGKRTIVVATFFCAVIAVAYAFLAKQVWTTEAVVTAPQIRDFDTYQEMVANFKPVLGDSSLESFIDPKQLFNVFIQQFQSSANKKAFIIGSSEFKDALKKEQSNVGDDAAEAKLYSKWIEKLSSTYLKSANNNDETDFTLQAQQETAQDSLVFLNNYVQYVEVKSRNVLMQNLYSIVRAKKQELEQKKNLLTNDAISKLKSQLLRSQYALDIAKAAGVSKPQQNLGTGEVFPINIGSNALAAKVDVLKGLKQLSIIEPGLLTVESQLALLKSSTIDSNVKFHTFQYIESPEKPLSRTSPKRSLITILGVLLGGMLGCAIVLVRHALREK